MCGLDKVPCLKDHSDYVRMLVREKLVFSHIEMFFKNNLFYRPSPPTTS